MSVSNSTGCTGPSVLLPSLVVLGLIKNRHAQVDILVLTYYSEELHVLRQLITNNHLGLKKILIQTVDSSQGNEKGIVIVSTTRAGSQRLVG